MFKNIHKFSLYSHILITIFTIFTIFNYTVFTLIMIFYLMGGVEEYCRI